MNIFITGASGFVGGAAARLFLANGHKVSAMSRSEKSDTTIVALGAEPVRCDLDTIKATQMQGIDVVIHAAAFVESWGPKDAWFRSNVLGTQAMLDTARAAGVKRFIHIGTEAAICHGQNINGADEHYPLAPDSSYPYCATKAQAEMRVRAANSADLTTIVLRPRFIWGPGDKTLLPSVEAMAQAGRFFWIDGGRAQTSTVHIANLCRAIDLALTNGQGGQAYFVLDDGEVSMKDMVTGMADSIGLTLPEKSAPSWLLGGVAVVAEWVWRGLNLKGEPPITRQVVMVMKCDCVLDGRKAREGLGYVPVISRKVGLAAMKAANVKSPLD
jgi:nucleoside-diphosphate-sugar epimerase